MDDIQKEDLRSHLFVLMRNQGPMTPLALAERMSIMDEAEQADLRQLLSELLAAKILYVPDMFRMEDVAEEDQPVCLNLPLPRRP